jgi:hypothetical protein
MVSLALDKPFIQVKRADDFHGPDLVSGATDLLLDGRSQQARLARIAVA